MPKTAKKPELENLGSLITVKAATPCLGYLMNFEGHGVYDANYGRVDVTPEDAKTHNQLLDEAMIKGLDESCKVGEGGHFYISGGHVKTWLGTLVAEMFTRRGKLVDFRRNGRKFRGIVSNDGDVCFFKRMS